MSSNKIHLSPAVIAVLDNAEVTDQQLVLKGTLDRALYLEVNKALEALGGKWNKKAKAHVFETDPRDLIEQAIVTESVVNMDKELDFFETPQEVAYSICDLAEIKRGHNVLEPSAGRGAIINILRADFDFWDTVDVCEIDEKRREFLMKHDKLRLMSNDFMQFRPYFQYDRIIANPPFSKRRDLDHVERMYSLLKPGGRLVAVMAAGIKFRQDDRTKQFLASMPYHHIDDLKPGSFRDAGTMVNAVIFTATHP